MDLDKVDAGAYGYKSAAPRVRKILMESTKKIKDLRTAVQDKKKSTNQKIINVISLTLCIKRVILCV